MHMLHVPKNLNFSQLNSLRIHIHIYISRFSTKEKETILNPLNIQLLGKSLSAKVFPAAEINDSKSLNRLQMQTLELSREHLESHQIPWRKERQLLQEISENFVPKLLGNSGTLTEHFQRMAADLGNSYFKLAIEFSKQISTNNKMIAPDKLAIEALNSEASGWFKWNFCGGKWNWEVASEGPTDKVIIFDIETCPLISNFPLIASAYGPSGWYFWISGKSEGVELKDFEKLIPLIHPILIIGHHVAFDRARIKEEYNLERSERRFLDTLSMHCAVAGLSSQQRGLWQERKKKKSMQFKELEFEELEDDLEATTTPINKDISQETEAELDQITEKWGSKSSLNNLADAFQLHCGRKLDKSVRDDILLKATSLSDVDPFRNEIMAYCAKDVEATAELFSVLLPKFLKKSPHPVTFTALLEMGSFVLPVVREEWDKYIKECDRLHDEATTAIELELQTAAEETMTEGLKEIEKTINDPWLKQLDWTVEPKRFTKARYLKDGVTFAKDGEPRLIGNSSTSGRPAWFKKLFKGGKVHVTPRTSIVPILLKLKWKGHVVQLIPNFGWCFEKTENENEKIIKFNGKFYQRIPHPGGRDENVGCLLTKNFLKYFQSGDLSTENSLIERVLEVNSRFSFWTGYRERVKEQFLVTNAGAQSLILPTVQPMGTVTRRAVEKTWLTASNAKERMVGTELKAMVKAPPGWCLVGADVDSQELWIGSLLGDAQFGWSGSTALGWMTLQGAKSDGTDLHSRTANILGMTRDNAKIFNYGRIYGAGVKYAAQLLLKFNPSLSENDAAARASELYHATKGRRVSNRRDAFVSYAGGTESYMFNQMEAIARAPISKTPVLSAEISDGLIAEHVDDNFITSRVNWVVQSSGVDYLHMLLVAVAFLFKRYKIPGRAALTIHDEVRFLVPENEKYRAALALQIANLWTRAAFVEAVGVHDLPLSVAFFSAVDIDTVLRKEVHLSCITPSNSLSIPPGKSLDIYKLLQNCSSLGESEISDISKDNFMYKFYAQSDESPVGGGDGLSFENEKKYLVILRKQMQKKVENGSNAKEFFASIPPQKRQNTYKNNQNHANNNTLNHVRLQNNNQSSSPSPTTHQDKAIENEFFNHWKKLITKKQNNLP